MENLYQEVHQTNLAMFGNVSLVDAKQESGGIFDTFKRAISGKVRSPSLESNLANLGAAKTRNNTIATNTLPPVGELSNEGTPVLVCRHGITGASKRARLTFCGSFKFVPST